MSLSSLLCTAAVVLVSTVAFGYLFVFRIVRAALRALGAHLQRRTAAKRGLLLGELAGGEGGGSGGDSIVVGFFHPFWYVRH